MSLRTLLSGATALLLCSIGCKTTGLLDAPAARSPELVSISAVEGRSCAWTAFKADRAGKFELLPSGSPTGDIRVVFRAPYPSRIQVDLGGRFALDDVERTTDRSKGYYRIDSVESAETDGAFLWKVTITPPTVARLASAYDLRIRNLSGDPSRTGFDKASAPLTLELTRRPVADVDGWLEQHPQVSDALQWDGWSYRHWSAGDKQVFRDAFELAWIGSSLPLLDPPPNRAAVGDADPPITVLASGHAKSIFIAHAAAGLASEIAGWTSWSITTYSPEQLALLLDSRRMFRWNARFNGFEVVNDTVSESVVPGSPRTILEFMYGNGLFTCESREAVMARTLAWSRANLSQFASDLAAKNMEEQWQYRGYPPVSRIIAGTPYPNSPIATFAAPHHRTAGCSGTVAFLHAVLRLANIPVKLEVQQERALPSFVTDKDSGHGAPNDRAYKVEALQAKDLWDRIDSKLDGIGGCAAFAKP